MSGLIAKNTQFGKEFINSNGAPIPGSPGEAYLKGMLKAQHAKSYNAGAKFVLEDITKRLKCLVYLNSGLPESSMPNTPLPDYAKEFSLYMECLTNFIEGMKEQMIRNYQKSFKEGARKIVHVNERMLGLKKGDILNTILPEDEPPVRDPRGNKPGCTGTGPKKKIIVSTKPIDPADLLINKPLVQSGTTNKQEQQ